VWFYRRTVSIAIEAAMPHPAGKKKDGPYKFEPDIAGGVWGLKEALSGQALSGEVDRILVGRVIHHPATSSCGEDSLALPTSPSAIPSTPQDVGNSKPAVRDRRRARMRHLMGLAHAAPCRRAMGWFVRFCFLVATCDHRGSASLRENLFRAMEDYESSVVPELMTMDREVEFSSRGRARGRESGAYADDPRHELS